MYIVRCTNVEHIIIIYALHRGAEAGGNLGVNTPPTFLGLHPHFLEGLKNGS